MNKLEMVNRLRRECGVSNASRPLTTLAGLVSAETARLIDWIDSCWDELQLRHTDWDWMLESGSVELTPNIRNYITAGTAAVDEVLIPSVPCRQFDLTSFRVYPTIDGQVSEEDLQFLKYPLFRDAILRGATRSNVAKPGYFTVDPRRRIVLDNLPPASPSYTITFDYWRQPTKLVADTDAPPLQLDESFHMIVVYRAMEHYAGFDAASEVYTRGKEKGEDLMTKLESSRLPTIEMGPPLA